MSEEFRPPYEHFPYSSGLGGLVIAGTFGLFGRYGVITAEPAMEIDIGAAGRAERMIFLLRGFAAKRARPPRPQAHRLSHG